MVEGKVSIRFGNMHRATTVLSTMSAEVNAVGAVNDGINIGQHLMADRYREAGIELGGAVGQWVGAPSGAAIGDLVVLAATTNPYARIGGAILSGTGGSYALGEAGKDMVRHFTAPDLPPDLDLTPHLVRDGIEYVMVKVGDGQIQWYQISRPTPTDYADDVSAAGDPLAPAPSTSTTYIAVTSPRLAGAVTDAFLRQELTPDAYDAYVAERTTLETPTACCKTARCATSTASGSA